MFSGIVEQAHGVLELASTAAGKRLIVAWPPADEEVELGESIAVNGVCLTVAERSSDGIGFDVIRETLDRSTLGRLQPGDQVNIERSLRAGDRISGHFVQGHVDGMGRVVDWTRRGDDIRLWVEPDRELLPYVIPKGSVALDGVSLTVADREKTRFSVALTPTTLERTTLGQRSTGEPINIETDMIVRTIVHTLQNAQTGDGMTVDWLAEHGFAAP